MKLKNNIKESYCSPEVSKLLKEKGFNGKTISFFDNSNKLSEPKDRKVDGFIIYNILPWNTIKPFYIARPTHSIAIEWIRVNFGIWVSTDYDTKSWFEIITIFSDNNNNDNRIIQNEYASPQEAIDAGLLYVLKNLIK